MRPAEHVQLGPAAGTVARPRRVRVHGTQHLDRDADGHISFAEFRNGLARLDVGMTAAELTEIAETMDVDQSGGIELDEFVAAFGTFREAERALGRFEIRLTESKQGGLLMYDLNGANAARSMPKQPTAVLGMNVGSLLQQQCDGVAHTR